MLIKHVTLKNIKSYGSSKNIVEFASHVNLIKGENGAGKTTLLEAIGYVLFGKSPYNNIKDFLHHGTKQGEIKVGIISPVDEREYVVIREIGNNSKVYVYDPELNQKIAEGKDDTSDWLHDHLQLDSLAEPSSLFEDVVGVAQGTMTAIFAEAAHVRESKFNKLLRVESYRDAYKKLNDTTRYIDALIQQNSSDQKMLEGILSTLPTQEIEYARITEALSADKDELDKVQERLTSVEGELEKYQISKQKLDLLLQETESYKLQLDQLREKFSNSEDELNKADNARQILIETAEAYQAYQAAEEQLKRLESKQIQQSQLQSEFLHFEGELREAKVRLEQSLMELAKVHQATQDMADLFPYLQQQESLESELGSFQEALRERQRLEKQAIIDNAEADKLIKSIENLQTALSHRVQLETLLVDLRAQRAGLDTQQREVDQQRTSLLQYISDLQPNLKVERERTQKYQLEKQNLERCQQDILQEMKNLERLQEGLLHREKIVSERNTVKEQLQDAQSLESDAKSSLKNHTQLLVTLTQRREMLESDLALCPICHRPMDEHALYDAQTHYEHEAMQIQAAIAKAQSDEKEAKKRIDTLFPQLQTLEKNLEMMETEQTLHQSQQKLDGFNNQKANFETTVELFQDAPTQLQQLETENEQLSHQLQGVETTLQELAVRYKQVAGEIEEHQYTLNKLPQQAELTDTQNEYNTLRASLKVIQEQLLDLADIDSQIFSIEQQLNTLENPRRRYQIAESIVATGDELEYSYEQHQIQRSKIESALEESRNKLVPFEGLNQEIEEARSKREISSKGYREYISYEKVAESFQDCQSRVEQLREEMASIQTQYDILQAQYTDQLGQYDQQKHQEFIAEQSQFTREQLVIGTRVEVNTDSLNRLQSILNDLRQNASELNSLQEKAFQLSEERDAFEFIRASIRDAGEKVRVRLVQSIGQQADTFFKQIMDDATQTLSWSSDYSISLTYRGETRFFKLLSGGEQMIAALSLRLALLTHMTSIRFVFLDEPTTNLDDKRRVNLAERLSTIQSLQQIFVISHDDTFEQGSNHIIEITKTSGISKVGADATL